MSEPLIPIAQVDAFTDRPFAGNPAAVCLLPEQRAAPGDDSWFQAVAAEMNLSETAFLVRRAGTGEPGGGRYGLRWFTPATEVDLCGHATLASAHLLWEAGHVPSEMPVRFETRSGSLTCERSGSEDGATVWMDFPAQPAEELGGDEARALGEELAAALGAEPARLARNRFDLLAELPSEEAVRSLRPDLARLAEIEARGVIVTAAAEAGGADAGSSGQHDFVSRFFGPRVGVPEDPVTGSAHCCLAPWWSARLGRESLVGFQASRRGGVVRTELAGPRVRLGGRAVTVLTGELRVGGGGAERTG